MNVIDRIRPPTPQTQQQGNIQGRSAFEPTRLIPVYETFLGLVCIVLLAAVWPGQSWGMLNVQPHPFWIVVLAIAVRYGAVYGYLSGGMAAITYTMLLWTRPGTAFQLVSAHDLIQPFLMFVTGAVLGEIVQSREQQIVDLRVNQADLQRALSGLTQRCHALERIKTILEKQILFQTNSVLTLSIIGRKLQSLSVPDIHKGLAELITTTLEADACALYIAENGKLEFASGYPEVWHSRQWVLDTQDPLIQQVLREQRVISIRDLKNAGPYRSNQTLIAGPLLLDDGELYGLVVVESIPFEAFSPSTLTQLEAILSWASLALRNALRYEQGQYQDALSYSLSETSPFANSDLGRVPQAGR
jgi:polysaccharide biosynthesis protein PelD